MRAALILVPLLCCTFLKNFTTTSWWNEEYSLSYAYCKFYIMQKFKWDKDLQITAIILQMEYYFDINWEAGKFYKVASVLLSSIQIVNILC